MTSIGSGSLRCARNAATALPRSSAKIPKPREVTLVTFVLTRSTTAVVVSPKSPAAPDTERWTSAGAAASRLAPAASLPWATRSSRTYRSSSFFCPNTAAPLATARSGSTRRGVRPKLSAILWATAGLLLMPPTSRQMSTLSTPRSLALASTDPVRSSVRCNKAAVISSKSVRVTVTLARRPP